MSHRQSKCDVTSSMVYRTLAENTWCEPLKFLPVKSGVKRTGLISFPGSGNTWTRNLIEQASGIYTGSMYSDEILFKKGDNSFLFR